MRTVTHIEKVKQADANDLEIICSILGWTKEQYCEHQFYNYTAFLKRVMHGKPVQALNTVMYSDVMRGFFNNEWSKRNQNEFLPFASDYFTHSQSYVCPNEGLVLVWDYTPFTDFLIDEYMYTHCPYLLINDKGFMIRFNNTINLIFK